MLKNPFRQLEKREGLLWAVSVIVVSISILLQIYFLFLYVKNCPSVSGSDVLSCERLNVSTIILMQEST